ncbi:MAG: hypothetical protein HY286_19205 [Planctomycetes bacterium]|nr:hypothetical protein [Planctomycetota bacterium]
MGFDSLNRVNGQSGDAVGRSNGPARPANDKSVITPRPSADPRINDAADFEAYSRAMRAASGQKDRIAKSLEERRKIVESAREALHSGALDTPVEVLRAAQGLLRRGAIG